MLSGYDPTVQALLGTLFTWALTAVGSALVFFVRSTQRWVLDGSLGFAAGVMTAASYWSLLDPAIDIAKDSGNYGANGEYAFVPAGAGFLLGALFVYSADRFIDWLGVSSTNITAEIIAENKISKEDSLEDGEAIVNDTVIGFSFGDSNINATSLSDMQKLTNRRKPKTREDPDFDSYYSVNDKRTSINKQRLVSWRRLLMLIIAITVHNIPEGLAVGVGFAAVNKSKHATFEKARNLAIGIGIQNFPEGLAVSLPLQSAGVSVWKSFWYGQLSGMVEPIAGVLGALLLSFAEPFLPYSLAFAAGAMIYVVVDDIIPEAHTCGNGTLASWSAIIGFWIMMSLDVGLGG